MKKYFEIPNNLEGYWWFLLGGRGEGVTLKGVNEHKNEKNHEMIKLKA